MCSAPRATTAVTAARACSPRPSTAVRRVDVKRGGATVASFYLAVFGHPGGKMRADTDADIEVPAQLLRDLFDGVTHMDALEIDADAL